MICEVVHVRSPFGAEPAVTAAFVETAPEISSGREPS